MVSGTLYFRIAKNLLGVTLLNTVICTTIQRACNLSISQYISIIN